jgi:hypothetical protein
VGPAFYVNDSAAEVRIETQHATYSVGDSIDLRITMRSGADHGVRLPLGGIFFTVPLRVVDCEGHDLRKNVLLELMPFGNGPSWVVGPKQECTFQSKHGSEWINLREWGYDLREPGSYTILGPRFSKASIAIKA